MEEDTLESTTDAKQKCEQNKSQLESLKEIMLKNKQSLEKKEEELQEYARRLSKIKSRAKMSRRSKEGSLPLKDASHALEMAVTEASEESIDGISQVKTAKARSTLLQRKLAENRKAFEQRNKEISETKRAVEEKVEAIRQQLEEQDVATMGAHQKQLSITPIKPLMIVSDQIMSTMQIEGSQEKEIKIAELSNKILELEATIVDLQENLKEKDSVIESKTKAVTLMSADLSKKGKTTLDTLEDTKDEMRSMQEHFVLLESTLKNKNESLLTQLQERDYKISELEDLVQRCQKEMDDKVLSESASASFSRSTMDTLVETKEAMKSMQENFVLIETSLKDKNANLLHQLKDYELKLAEANERIFKLESGVGIVRDPAVEDLQFKLEKIEHSNKQLQDERFELQKNVTDLQDKIINISTHGNGAIIEKDNRIMELENLVEELKQSNKLLEEESKAELQKQVIDLTIRNEEYLNKITDLESMVHKLEEQKNDMAAKLPEDNAKDDEKVIKLSKELEDLNKSMIKIKAQHKNKLKNLQKQLENFKKVSDANTELVRLGNQVALLEEEKGNLQLSLVDFDELKASAGDWQERVVDLESKVSAQTKEIEMQIEAIATLENQKLDLIQELHTVKQEISTLEAENAESENLRVTAEMKVVDLEERLEVMERLQKESKRDSFLETNHTQFIKQIEALTQENNELYNRISKLEEKGTSDTGSTESFEAIQDLDKADLLKKIEDLTQRNNELTNRLRKRDEEQTASTELINEDDKNELLKKIEQLTQETANLTMKLNRLEEKGSSDTGSTESFERIPEQNESLAKIEQVETVDSEVDSKLRIDTLLQDNENQSIELEKLKTQVTELVEKNNMLQKEIKVLSAGKTDLPEDSLKQTHETSLLEKSQEENSETLQFDDPLSTKTESMILNSFKEELDHCKKVIAEQTGLLKEMKAKLENKAEELEQKCKDLIKCEASGKRKIENLENQLRDMSQNIEEWISKYKNLEREMGEVEAAKGSIENKFRMLQMENEELLKEKKEVNALREELQSNTFKFESKLQEQLMIISEKEDEIISLKEIVEERSQELHGKYTELQNKMIVIDALQDEVNNCQSLIQEKDDLLSSISEETSKLNETIKNKEEETYALRKDITELNRKLEESKPLKDYNYVVELLENKEILIDELQYRVNATIKENDNLSEKVKNLSQQNNDIFHRLDAKQLELTELTTIRDRLETQLAEANKDKNEAEKRLWELQITIDNNTKFADDLRSELQSSYKGMEQLKMKHTEDMVLQNQRLENLIEELNGKMQECEMLKNELAEKDALLAKNMTEEVKVSLEAKVSELQEKLVGSEEKIHMQLEKMKKIAANLKKKTAVCQDLENRVVELEEKWMTEKDEKEAKNKQIQDVEIVMREKDNRIVHLEEKLAQARNEIVESTRNIEQLENDLTSSKEKILLFTRRLDEMSEEVTKLRAELVSNTAKLQAEEQSRENILSEYESYKKQVMEDNERKETELEEMKEKARELSVRMVVMETEYLEQLTSINDLKAENGLLLSKQAQINERLENVEKENEERKVLIEQLEKAAILTSSVSTLTETTQTGDEDVSTEDGSKFTATLYTHCEQCQTLVQALEAKLQEREAEIENLDNELANSIGNFVQMHESMRYKDLMAEEPYNELLSKYNSLLANHEAVNAKLEEALKENKELEGRINELQSSNNTLEEKIVALEKLEDIQLLNKELIEKCEVRERELLNLQQEMQAVQLQLNSQIIGRKSVQVEKEEVEKQLNSTKAILEEEIKFLKLENEANERTMADLKMEIELYKNQIAVFTDKTSTITEKTSVTDDITPQLFDASKIFGIPSTSNSNSISQSEVKHLRKLLEEKELECTNLTQTTNHLQKHMAEERTHLSQNCSEHIRQLETTQQQLRAVQANLDRLEEVLIAKDKQIDSLNIKLHNVTVELMDQQNDTSKNNLVEQLKINLDELRSRLNETIGEREEQKILIDTYKSQVENLEAELKSFSDSDIVSDLENKVSSLTKERDLLQLQVTDLSRSLEELKERITREREEAKELATNFTEALNDACKKSNKRFVPPEKLTESIQQQVSLDVNAIWSTGSTEKLNIDEEEGWLWNAEDNQLAEAQEATPALVSDVEMQLRVKINDLQDQIKDVEKEKEKMLEDNKVAQLRNAKMIKKLKEYKVQVENLQQQLKVQKTAGDFYELDSAIEEELKSQITKLEKALEEIKAERKTIVAEKEALTKRLDVVVSANERYLELKEKQDMEMEVLRIRNKELSDKTESLDRQLQEFALEKGDEIEENEKEHRRKRSVDQEVFETLSKKYKDELEVLKDEMETLATENEQLQQILGEQKTKLSKLESKRTVEENESIEIVDDLNRKISELQGMLSKSREEYDLLRKQYEQSLMDANDQVAAMRQNTDFLKEESFEKINKLETEVSSLRQQIEALERNSSELQNNLRDTLQEKLSLEERFNTLTVSNEMQISSANVSMAEITDLLNTRIQEVATLKQELQRQYVEQEEIKSGLQDTIHMLNQELVEKKQEVQNLTKALGDNEKEIIQQQSVETLSALVNQTTQEIVQNHAIEIQKKENEICSLKKELELSTQSLLEKQSIVESINENITITNEKLIEKESEVIETQKRLQKLLAENESYVETIQELRKRLNESEAHIHSLEQETEDVKIVLKEKKSSRDQYEDEAARYQNEIETIKTELLRKEEQINALNLELEETRGALCEARQSLNAKQAELESSFNIQDKSSSNIVDGLPLFRMGDDDKNLQQTIDMMQGELQMKQTELEHLKYILDNNTYPSMIQEMQERINCLYNERSELEAALRMADELAGQKEKEIDALKQRIDVQDLELISSKDVNHSLRDRRSTELQEQIVSLQNKLYAKEQEINELKYIVAEKDSQLSFQASMEPQSDDFELRETLQRLTTDLYGREQEIEHLKTNIVHLQNEVARLQAFERLSEETRNAVEKLYVEKEQVRVHAEEFLEEKLKEKSIEIDEIKGRLSMENQRILDELRLRDKDVENLRRQLNQFKMSEEKVQDELREKNDEFLRVSSILAEKERRLAELSITKDTELHNLKVQIREKEARIEELLALSDEEEKQLNELKNTLEARETEINSLKTLLEDKVKEYELLQNVLKKNISVIDSVASISGETSSEENKPSTSQELDLALYMLHQRDVRCEELTQELMQLLEERDTLQLRLSNAIRVNEELRKIGGNAPTNSDIDSKKEGFTSDRAEPVAEQSDSSKSDGPVEIAKEAIDSPLEEDKKSLALKLSQLHTMSYAKDVRLRDERELRHTQQMSLLAHKDVLSTLPPEAAAKLVNANYTLSRDVQSQSSVLLNWLWGKSTPKVIHM